MLNTQTVRQQIADELSVFDHFVELKGLILKDFYKNQTVILYAASVWNVLMGDFMLCDYRWWWQRRWWWLLIAKCYQTKLATDSRFEDEET